MNIDLRDLQSLLTAATGGHPVTSTRFTLLPELEDFRMRIEAASATDTADEEVDISLPNYTPRSRSTYSPPCPCLGSLVLLLSRSLLLPFHSSPLIYYSRLGHNLAAYLSLLSPVYLSLLPSLTNCLPFPILQNQQAPPRLQPQPLAATPSPPPPHTAVKEPTRTCAATCAPSCPMPPPPRFPNPCSRMA